MSLCFSNFYILTGCQPNVNDFFEVFLISKFIVRLLLYQQRLLIYHLIIPWSTVFFKKKKLIIHKLLFQVYSNNGTPSISIVPRIFLTLSGLSQANPSGSSVASSLVISNTYNGKLAPCDCVFVNSTSRILLTLISVSYTHLPLPTKLAV